MAEELEEEEERSKMLRGGGGAGTSSRYAYTLLDDHRQYKV